MKLKLKEDPKEWFKFTAVMALVAVIIIALLIRSKVLSPMALVFAGVFLHFTLIACWVRTIWFRGFYRVGMTMVFRVGQIMSWVWLTLFFLLILTPLALLLRVLGKDLLKLKRSPGAASYWNISRPPGPFDRMF